MAIAPSCMKLPYATEIKINKLTLQCASLLCLHLILIFFLVFLLLKRHIWWFFSLNISSSNFELFVLASYQVSTHTEIYFWHYISKYHFICSPLWVFVLLYAKTLAFPYTLRALTVENLTNFLWHKIMCTIKNYLNLI